MKIPPKKTFAQYAEDLEKDDQDFVLAYLFMNFSELEENSDITRQRWKQQLNKIRVLLKDCVLARAGSVSEKFTNIFRKLADDLDGDGRENNPLEEFLISTFFQRPQPRLGELATEVISYYTPGLGELYELYDPKDGMKVKVKKQDTKTSIVIKLDGDRLKNIKLSQFSLFFDYKSNDIDEVEVEFAKEDHQQLIKKGSEILHGLNKGHWISLEVKNIPVPLKDVFSHIIIYPKDTGIFYLSKMRLVSKE